MKNLLQLLFTLLRIPNVSIKINELFNNISKILRHTTVCTYVPKAIDEQIGFISTQQGWV